MAHVIEARGIRTLVVGTALDIMSEVRRRGRCSSIIPRAEPSVHRMTEFATRRF
jgi:hypothetical protein